MESWSEYVNSDFYGQDGGYQDNVEEVKFKGGRKIGYLRNSTPRKSHELNLRLADKGTERRDGKTEFEHFIDWFENTVKSGTVPFLLDDIITGNGKKAYRIKVGGWTGQRYKEVSVTLEEY